VISSGTGFLVPVASRLIFRKAWHQRRDVRTTRFHVRAVPFVRVKPTLRHVASIASRFPRLVTIAMRPSCGGGMRGKIVLICPTWQAPLHAAK
jgi:hypothetical protein